MKRSTKKRVKEECWDIAKGVIITVVAGIIMIIIGGSGSEA